MNGCRILTIQCFKKIWTFIQFEFKVDSIHIKLQQIGVQTQGEFSRWISNCWYLSQVKAWSWVQTHWILTNSQNLFHHSISSKRVRNFFLSRSNVTQLIECHQANVVPTPIEWMSSIQTFFNWTSNEWPT